jgi:hypothetical protein
MLARLALCRRPGADSVEFADQVRQIAAYTGIRAAVLANVIRQVDSLESLAGRPETPDSTELSALQPYPQLGLLAAARDRCEIEEEQEPSSSEHSESDE